MKKLMNGAQMKRIDTYSIQEVGIPSLVLMERAALCVTEAVLEKIKKTDKVLCVCGSGNNGADGMAVARQLTERGISAEVYTTAEKKRNRRVKSAACDFAETGNCVCERHSCR